jgi:hypothetical protein
VVDTDGVVEIKDFSFSIEPKRFRINDDIFEATPEMPLTIAVTAAKIASSGALQKGDMEPVLEFFDEILLEESAARFRQRMTEDKKQPIGMRHINAIIPWLLEEYGLRPTAPSSDSSDSQDGTGMSSTAGALSDESILSSSDSHAS